MNLRSLALISTLSLGLALAGSALAQEQDQQPDAHHEGAGAAAASSGAAAEPAPAAGDDADAMEMDGAGMMICSRMMAMMGEMMGGGGGHSGQDGMKGHGMHEMMKDHPPKMGGDHMKGHGKAGMAQHGLARLLAADEVGKRLDQMIAHNKRLKVGKIEPGGDFTFGAEITTVDGSLVHKLLIDRRDGTVYEIE